MQKLIKAIVCFLVITSILFMCIFFSGINEAPRIYEKVVIDIRNESGDSIKEMYVKAEATETFISKEDIAYKKEVYIPEIGKKERCIVVLDQSKISIPGMKLRLSCNGFNDWIADELHKNSGSVHIVTIKKDGRIEHEEIYNFITQKLSLFYWKPYKNVYELPAN